MLLDQIKLVLMGITFIVFVVVAPFFMFGCSSQPTICPELTVKFCPSK